MTCSAPGARAAEAHGRSPESGAFALAPATRSEPTRSKSQFKHAMKCNVTTQAVKHDPLLRGVMSETPLAVFRFVADGALDRESPCTVEGGARAIPDAEGTRKQKLRGMVDSY